MKLLNSFSINMLASMTMEVTFKEVLPELASAILGWAGLESAVGHAQTAVLFEKVLGLSVPVVRSTVTLVTGEVAMIGQYSGPRLEEGAIILPEGAKIHWVIVTVGGRTSERDFCGYCGSDNGIYGVKTDMGINRCGFNCNLCGGN